MDIKYNNIDMKSYNVEMKIHRYNTDKILVLSRIKTSSLLSFMQYYLNGQTMIETLYMKFIYEDILPLDLINYYNNRHRHELFLNDEEEKQLNSIMNFVNYEIQHYELNNSLSYF